MFSYSFSNIPQFGFNISASNHQNIVKGVCLNNFDTPETLGVRIHSEDIMIFVIVFYNL